MHFIRKCAGQDWKNEKSGNMKEYETGRETKLWEELIVIWDDTDRIENHVSNNSFLLREHVYRAVA
jgi:hypothetical protein